MVTGSVGERIAAYRRRRGLSQAAVAGLVGRSESWLSQVERGVRSVDRLSVLLDLSNVLHVEVSALIGTRWQDASNGGAVLAGVEDVRRFLTRYDKLCDGAPSHPTNLAQLRSRVDGAHSAYQAARYEQVMVGLPDLLTALEGAASSDAASAADTRREELRTHVSGYVLAAKLLTKVGAGDLALLAADRAANAAVNADSMSGSGLAAYQVVCALLRLDRTDDAEALAVRMAERVRRAARRDKPALVSAAGALWLIAAIAAARRADGTEAWHRLDEAESLANLLGQDGNFGWTAFGPTNVAIHRVSVAAELADPAEALRAAARVDPARLPAGLTSRQVQVHLDLAAAYAQRKRDADALLHLLEAERQAPESVRYNVRVRELVRTMLVRKKRTNMRTLHALAARAGVLD